MRLIDIDKHFELNEPFYKADIEMPLHRVKVALESLPTVQAITIEWLEKYKRVRGWEVTVTTLNAIDNMLNAWEKENEANRR